MSGSTFSNSDLRSMVPTTTRRGVIGTALRGTALLVLGGTLLHGRSVAAGVLELDPPLTLPHDLPKVSWSLAVAEPAAPSTVGTTELTSLHEGSVYSHSASDRWSDRPAKLMQAAIIKAFRESGSIANVGTPEEISTPAFVLNSSLTQFNLQDANNVYALAHVALDARLTSGRDMRVVATKTFDREAMPGWSLDEAKAFNRASGEVIARLVPWALRTGQETTA